MTIKSTIATIKAINSNLTVKCVGGEYRVSIAIPYIQNVNDCDHKTAMARNEATAYYTDDSEDAILTAQAMWFNRMRDLNAKI